MFDIAQLHLFKRNALRGILKRLQFYQLQKSIWIHPFDCQDEFDLLKDFFGLTVREMRFVVANDIGDDQSLRTMFKLQTV
ncbi:MAG: hypothetical protein HYW95_02790 [Candidatus Wildermuthbacteria bacterium]|nr:hypothetical protein [Candidatus Wildermuthbacteria bacterium]